MWILLVLSAFCSGLHLKYLVQQFMYDYWLNYVFAAVIICCSFAAWRWGRDLGLFGPFKAQLIQAEPAPKKMEPGKEMTELDWYVVMNREALDKYLSIRGTSIVLNHDINSTPGNYSLVCKKNSTGHYDVAIFPNGCEASVPYDEHNLDHQELYRHFRLKLGNTRDLIKEQEISGSLNQKVVPIRRH